MIARINAVYQGYTPMSAATVSSMSKKKMINVRKRCTRVHKNLQLLTISHSTMHSLHG